MSTEAALTSTAVTREASKKSAVSTSKPPPTPMTSTRGRGTELVR
jgi:hypothetical protein